MKKNRPDRAGEISVLLNNVGIIRYEINMVFLLVICFMNYTKRSRFCHRAAIRSRYRSDNCHTGPGCAPISYGGRRPPLQRPPSGAGMCADQLWRPQAAAATFTIRGRAHHAAQRRYQIVGEADTAIVNCPLSIRPSTVRCPLKKTAPLSAGLADVIWLYSAVLKTPVNRGRAVSVSRMA